VDKFSQLVIRESSDFFNTTSDAELSDWGKEEMQFAAKLACSKDPVDQRLRSLYNIRNKDSRI